MKKIKKNKIARFTRVSSIEQQLNGSLETQKMNCFRKLEELRIHNDYEIIDFGGVVESAKTGGTTFQELESCVLNKMDDFKVVIVSQMDRLSRNSEDGALFIALLRKAKKHIISADGRINTMTNVKDYDEAMRLIRVGEEDNEAKAYRTVNGNLNRLLKGYWVANAPFGYTRIDKYKIVPNEDAHYISTIFDMYIDGYSSKQIREYLKDKGLNVAKSTLSDWLRNTLFCGRMLHKSYKNKEEYLIGNHEPIVSPYVFDLVQESLVEYNTRECKLDERTPIKKMLKCNCCGSNMTAYSSKDLWYYKCNAHDCNNHFSAEMAHNAISDVIRKLEVDLTKDQVTEVIEELYEEYHSSDLQVLKNRERELNSIINQKKTYINTCLETGFEIISKDDMMERVNVFEEKIKGVKETIDGLNATNFEAFKQEQLTTIASLNEAINLDEIGQAQNVLSVVFDGKIIFNKKTKGYDEINVSPLFISAA